jgi:hypothetical protein
MNLSSMLVKNEIIMLNEQSNTNGVNSISPLGKKIELMLLELT